jgi:hypothetical protein
LRFSAAIDGSAIHSCSRVTFSVCIFGICANTAALSGSLDWAAASTAAGAAASAKPVTVPCTNSRLLKSRT